MIPNLSEGKVGKKPEEPTLKTLEESRSGFRLNASVFSQTHCRAAELLPAEQYLPSTSKWLRRPHQVPGAGYSDTGMQG